jgi:hypothetical protein
MQSYQKFFGNEQMTEFIQKAQINTTQPLFSSSHISNLKTLAIQNKVWKINFCNTVKL